MRLLHVLTAALLTTACATPTSKGVVDPAMVAAPITADPFEPLEEGGYWHPASKGRCPPELAGFAFDQTQTFNDDPNNVGCQYTGAGYLTVYFFVAENLPDARTSALDAANAIVSRFDGAEPLKDKSQDCSMTADLRQGIADALASAVTTDKTITIGTTPCYVFRIPQGLTLVTTDMIGPWHLKVRITIPNEAGDGSNIAVLGDNVLNYERSTMAGKPASVLDELLKPDTE